MKADVKTLKLALSIINPMADYIGITPKEDGWQMFTRSRDNVSLISLIMGKEAFTDYDENMQPFTVDVLKTLKAIKDKGKEVEIEVGNGTIKLKGDGLTTKFGLSSEEPMEPKFPKCDPQQTATIVAGAFQRVISAMDEKCPSVRVKLTEDGVDLIVYNDQGNGSDLHIPVEECAALNGTASAGYPIDEVYAFMNQLPADEFVKIRLDNDFPLFAELEYSHCKIKWVVAPRIEDDE